MQNHKYLLHEYLNLSSYWLLETLTASELQLANEIMEVLQPLEKVKRELCRERFVTASKIIPLINCLQNNKQDPRESL